ncbi:MAG: helicase-associated domain-containing protein [Thermoflavifilum sp.]|nr:helicase-associated domain-containing protein [Thermoflavifilum sp.]MCL6513949.1 helicase-associated domain-containing protein [Alicyclobacillus sp.]
MKLAECLNTADITTLRRIADHYGLPGSRHSKLALLQEILFAFRSRPFLDAQVSAWHQRREQALIRLCLDPRSAFSAEELQGLFRASGLSEDSIGDCVSEGWLFPTTRFRGRLQYCIPEELKQRLRACVIGHFAQQVVTSDEGPVVFQDEEHALARDLDVLLEYTAHHDVRLTVDGAMYKRNLQQLLELLEIREAPLEGGWRFGYGRRFHDYPDRLALIYDFAYAQRYIEERDDGRLAVTDEAAEWMRLGAVEKQRALFKFYVSLYRRPILRLPQIIQLLAHVGTRWTESASMLQALGPLVNAYYYDTREQVWNSRILKMMLHLGLIRRGHDETGRDWFQITKLGQQLITPDALPSTGDEDRAPLRILIVQPNFEIAVTGETPFILNELSHFATLHQGGALRIYRITEESVQDGLKAGHRLSEWLEFLHAYAQTAIPGNVERALRDWDKRWWEAHGVLSS